MPKYGMLRSRAICGRLHHAARAAIAEAAGHQNAVGAVERAAAVRLLERLGLDPLDVHLQPVLEAAVVERLVQALVGILVADVLADHVDGESSVGCLIRSTRSSHACMSALGLRQVQVLQHDAVEPFGGEHERHFVDVETSLAVMTASSSTSQNSAILRLRSRIEEPIGAAQQDVGLDADRSQIAHAVLRRLRLELAGGADERHQRQVDVERVVAADVLAELADRLEERQALDVADGAADLDEHDVDVLGDGADRVLDLVGDVRNHLHGAAEIVAAPLLLDDALVDLAGRPVRVLAA